jgi:hypothetical protein
MTWKETENMVNDCIKNQVPVNSIINIAYGLPFLDGVNFALIYEKKTGIKIM